MSYFALNSLLAMAPPPGTQPNPTGELLKMVALMGLFIGAMYLVMIRPQQKKAKEHDKLLKSLKAGDKVVTSGGVVGVVVTVKEKSISLRSADTKLEVLKSAVTDVTERASNGGEA